MKKVVVLLSSYNGEKYIRRQMDSILNQSYESIELIIRDDGSTDDTVSIIKEYQSTYEGIRLVEGKNIGFLQSFMELLSYETDADYFSFADQDDEWYEDKIKDAVEWMEKQDSMIPLLYHSAYEVRDMAGNKKDVFLFENEGYDFRKSITENHYSGFSMVVNRVLREEMRKGTPERIGYHDWWAAMIVQGFGKAYFSPKVNAVHYAHGTNVTKITLASRVRWFFKTLCEESEIRMRAKEYQRLFEEKLSQKDKEMLDLFAVRHYNMIKCVKKAFYPKRWRPSITSEIAMRCLMVIGKI